jgi:hypothetical protein
MGLRSQIRQIQNSGIGFAPQSTGLLTYIRPSIISCQQSSLDNASDQNDRLAASFQLNDQRNCADHNFSPSKWTDNTCLYVGSYVISLYDIGIYNRPFIFQSLCTWPIFCSPVLRVVTLSMVTNADFTFRNNLFWIWCLNSHVHKLTCPRRRIFHDHITRLEQR